VWELALRRWRTIHRSALPYGVVAFVLATWGVLHQTVHSTPYSAVVVFFLGGLIALAIGAGAIARDFESGVIVLDRAHGAGPADVVLGTTIYTCTAVFAGSLLAGALTFAAAPQYLELEVLRLLGVVALGLVGWVALLVFLGSLVPGSGNSAIAFALVVILNPVSGFDQPGASLPVRASARLAAAIFPPQAALGFLRTPETASAWQAIGMLAVSTVLFLGLATAMVARREPARGWKR
jgi:hypothetical protein